MSPTDETPITFADYTTVVKWATATEELMGVAALAKAVCEKHDVQPKDVAIAVPHYAWGLQVRKACRHVETPAILCMTPDRLTAPEQTSLMKLQAIAYPNASDTHELWARLGVARDRAARITATYERAHAFALARYVGLLDHAVFENALQHATGEENACQLLNLIRQQLEHPALAEQCDMIPIMHYASVNGSYAKVFIVGCVNGLIPPNYTESRDDSEHARTLTRQSRSAFRTCCASAESGLYLSCFSKTDAAAARAAHICAARMKTERGKQMAMTMPTVFLTESGATRPSTVGGQALLRSYDIN